MPSPLLDIDTSDVGVGSVRIIYDFCTEAEERHLLEKIAAVGGDAPAGDAGAAGNGDGVEGADVRQDGEAADGQSAVPQPAGGASASKAGKAWGWKELNGRRSMYWGGTLLPSSGALVPAPFPPFMDGQWPDVLGRIAETGVYDEWTGGKGKGKERGPNHCLVNEYLPGQGIMPHTDGPSYLPCTTTLSLGSGTVLCLRSKPAHLASSTPSSSASPSPASPAEPAPANGASPSAADSTSPSLLEDTSTPKDSILKVDIYLPPRSLLVLSGELYTTWLHGIQPLSADPSSVLKGCKNWEQLWEWETSRARARGMLAAQGAEAAGGGGGGKTEEEVARMRGFVESGGAWERGKRVSLTCRRVAKVRKGFFKLG
ncbi:hypothetical protein JCM10213_003104 [Rhodosporidiobolus nylandii]